MLTMNGKLNELAEQGKYIKVAIVGAGKMGKGLINQMSRIKGMSPSLVVNRNIEKAVDAFLSAGIGQEDIVISNSLNKINYYLEKGKYIASEGYGHSNKG
ncbi:hypothetical protein [Schnuerera ultunensis]|uniref:SAF domain protein n=1 Tax=[Clostridium] ultunense Esp TaxID=1288971 RepID=A0A1M4PT37_9FIRM